MATPKPRTVLGCCNDLAGWFAKSNCWWFAKGPTNPSSKRVENPKLPDSLAFSQSMGKFGKSEMVKWHFSNHGATAHVKNLVIVEGQLQVTSLPRKSGLKSSHSKLPLDNWEMISSNIKWLAEEDKRRQSQKLNCAPSSSWLPAQVSRFFKKLPFWSLPRCDPVPLKRAVKCCTHVSPRSTTSWGMPR